MRLLSSAPIPFERPGMDLPWPPVPEVTRFFSTGAASVN
jgi:hypothetical protein